MTLSIVDFFVDFAKSTVDLIWSYKQFEAPTEQHEKIFDGIGAKPGGDIHKKKPKTLQDLYK